MSWPTVALGEIALSVRNGIFARRPSDEPGGSPILRISAVRDGHVNLGDTRFVTGLDASQVKQFSISQGDLLLTRYNGSRHLVGTSGIVPPHDGHVIHPDKLIRVVIDCDRADSRFVNYQFQSPQVRAHLEPRIRTTAGQSGIAGADIRSVPVVLPPLDEQRRIVDLLEDHLSRLDAAADGLLKTRKRTDSFERSALDTHFAMGRRVPLTDLIEDISAGKSFGTSNSPAGEDDWGIIKVSAMTWGRFNPDENKAVSGDRVDPRFEIREGDLLVSRANTADYVGASVLVGPVRPKLLLSDKSLRLIPKADVNPEWLWRALQSPSARRQITASATGTKDSMRNISQVALRQVLLPKVGESMQSDALNAFAAVAMSTNRLRTEIDSFRVRLGILRRSLLADAFSGRLTSAPLDLPQGKSVNA